MISQAGCWGFECFLSWQYLCFLLQLFSSRSSLFSSSLLPKYLLCNRRNCCFHLPSIAVSSSMCSYTTLSPMNFLFPEIIQYSFHQGPRVCGTRQMLTFQMLRQKWSEFSFIFFAHCVLFTCRWKIRETMPSFQRLFETGQFATTSSKTEACDAH